MAKVLPIAGIYCITNTKNGRRYIGESSDILGRWAKHRDLLKSSKHHSSLMIADCQRFGIGSFRIEVVEAVKGKTDDLEYRRDREKEWIAELHPEYNSIHKVPKGLDIDEMMQALNYIALHRPEAIPSHEELVPVVREFAPDLLDLIENGLR